MLDKLKPKLRKAKTKYLHLRKALPKTLDVEITWNCNLNCVMCPRRKGHGQDHNLSGKELTVENMDTILQKIPSVNTVNIIGAGEPMVHQNFTKLLNLIYDKGKKIIFTTNGTLLSEENIRSLPSSVSSIYVSIDSPIPEQYEKIRLGADFNNIIRNLESLRDIRPDIDLVIQTLILTENLSELPKMIDICKEVDASLSLIHPISFTREMQKNHIHTLSYEKRESSLDEIYDYARTQKVDTRTSRPPTPEPNNPCLSPWESVMVSVIGDIYPCCYIYEGRGEHVNSFNEWYNDEKITVPMENYRMGNIFQDDFEDVWFNDKYHRLRRHLLKMNDKADSPNRGSSNISEQFNYCDVCLYRWKCAC